MRKNSYIFIVIFCTFVSVVTMMRYGGYVSNSNQYEEGNSRKLGVNLTSKDCSESKPVTENMHTNIAKKGDEKPSSTKYYLEEEDLYRKGFNNDYKNEEKKGSDILNADSSNMNMREVGGSKEIYDDIEMIRRTENLEGYYYDSKENEQSVFKVSTGDIEENLTTSDKIKLLYVSMKLGKEDYKKVEKYLYAEDAEDGVLKALKLLKEDLSKKEYEKVRKIAIRFIDMDAAEELY